MKDDYLAYMVRLWQVNTDKGPVWRASVHSPYSGERRGFADLEALFAFLVEKTQEHAQGAQRQGPVAWSEE